MATRLVLAAALLSTSGAVIFVFFSAAQNIAGLLNIREWLTR